MGRSTRQRGRSGERVSEPPIPLTRRLHDMYEALPGSERKIADLILDFPGEVAAYSATELAALAGASKAAVTRLVRRLGYDSFETARRAARDARDWGSPLYMLHSSAEPEPFETRVRAHVERDVANLARTFEGLVPETVNESIDALAAARRVWLFGYRNSHYLAAYARWQFIQARADVHLLPMAGETLAEYVEDFDPADVLVVVAFRRRVPTVERIIDIAMRRGTRVLVITETAARLRARATWTLRCELRGEELFDRYTAAISLLHLLCVELVGRTGTDGRRSLERIETLHEQLHDLG